MSEADLVYAMAWAQHNLHDTLLRAVRDSGKSADELAAAGATPRDVVDRARASPHMMRDLNLAARLIYAATGACITFKLEWPKAAYDAEAADDELAWIADVAERIAKEDGE